MSSHMHSSANSVVNGTCVCTCIYIHMYAQVLSGLSYLASLQHSVIHYDLKPANIMLTTRNEVRLTDVGLAAECT